MKVLMVTPSYYPIIGGTETAVKVISIKLNEIGIHTDIMTFNMNSKWNPIWKEKIEKNGSLKIIKIPAFNHSRFFPMNLLKIFQMNVIPKPSFVKKFKDYDIIHFHSEADLSFPIFSYFIKKPKIFHSHGAESGVRARKYSKKDVLMMSGFKLIFSHLANLYVGYSEKLLIDIGAPKSKILSLPLGVDTNTFRPDESKKLDNLLLFIGRIDKEKGLHILLEALSHLAIQTRLTIIGPKWDKEYAEACLQTVEKINKKGFHKVEYLGAMNLSAIVPWYQKATVNISPYLPGVSGGLASLEALACGTPVIGTGNHLIINGVNGIIVPPNNPKKLAEAIEKLLKDKEIRKKYGKEGRRLVQKQFSLEYFIKKLTEVYQTMLNV